MMKKTKIVATIGPATEKKEILQQLIEHGVNVCRINFSHSTHDEARAIASTVREINKEQGTNVALLGDLQGPKIRLGKVEKGSIITAGEEIEICYGSFLGNAQRVSISYTDFARDVLPGELVLVDDGKLRLEVLSTDGRESVRCKVIFGGEIRSNKGVNLPNTKLSTPSLTSKDVQDLAVIVEEQFEWVGLSFVRSAQDIRELQQRISKANGLTRVVAKIEKPEALTELEEIIAISGAVMIARGDLGVEIPMEQVPSVQRQIIKLGLRYATPTIVATQMMESMITSPSPTRAEVNDVASAVYESADAVMLSAETSVGDYPIEVIKAMSAIIHEVENGAGIKHHEFPPILQNERYISNSICYQACKLADQIEAQAIVCMTHSGFNAFKIASHRPVADVCVFTHNTNILNTLSLIWGTRGFYYGEEKNTDDTISDVQNILKEKGYVSPSDYMINIASIPVTEKGMTNMLKLSQVE